MSLLQEARQRIKRREETGRNATRQDMLPSLTEEDRVELQRRKWYAQHVKPEVSRIENDFWKKKVPPQHYRLFEEAARAIEKKERIKLNRSIEFHHGPASTYVQEEEQLAALWQQGRLGEIKTGVKVDYSQHSGDGLYGYHIFRIEFSVDEEGQIRWGAGLSGRNICDNSEAGLEGLAETLVQILDSRRYYSYRPPSSPIREN